MEEKRYPEAFEHWKNAYQKSLESGDKSVRKTLIDKIIPGVAELGQSYPEAHAFLDARLRVLAEASVKSEDKGESLQELVEICAYLKDTETLLKVLKGGDINGASRESLRMAALPVLVDNGLYTEAGKYCDIVKTVAFAEQFEAMREMLGAKTADKLCMELLSPCYEAFLGNGNSPAAKEVSNTILQIDPSAESDLKRRSQRVADRSGASAL